MPSPSFSGCCSGSGGGGGGGAVTSVFGRTGAVVAVAGDYTAPQITFTPTATLPVVTDVDAALNALSHSINTLTIWVAQGDENAVDPPGRVGISPYDARHPFLTLGAALAAVTVSNTTIRIRTGYYDEDVTAPAFDVAIIGDGPDVMITRIQFTSGSNNYLQNVRMVNDPLVSSAPNLSPIVLNNAGLLIRDVLNEEYFIDDITGNPQALLLTAGGTLRLYTSNLTATQVVSGAGGSTLRAISGLKAEGAGTSSILAVGCKFTGISASDDDSAGGIWWATTGVNSNLSLTACDYFAETQAAAALGTAANIFAVGAGVAGRVDAAGGMWEARANVLSTSPVVLAYVAAAASTIQVNISHPTVRSLTGNAGKIGAGACDVAGNTLRLLDVSWPTFTTIPVRQGALSGAYVHEGVLGNGDRFPAPFWIDTLTVWVAQGDENATDSRAGLSPYDQNYPFLTLTAAMAAITLLATPNITVRVRTGYYDEDVAVPSDVAIIGDGPEVFLVRLTFNSGECYVENVRFYNDATSVSAPNLAPLFVANGTLLGLKDVIAIDYYADNLAAETAALLIEDSFVRAEGGCQFYAYQLTGGVGSNGPVWCGAMLQGANPAVLYANAVSFIGFTNVERESAGGVYHANTAGITTVSCVACVLTASLGHVSATGAAAPIITANASGNVFVSGGQGFVDVPLTASPGLQVASICLGGTVTVDISSIQVYLRGPALNQGGGVAQGAGVTLRMLDMVWPDETVEPPRLGLLTGTYAHEGVLGTGARFPSSGGSANMISGNTLWVDANAPTATDTRGILSPFDQANPWATIAAAVAAANPGFDVVRVRAGEYVPSATIVVPAFQQVVGEEGATLTNGTGLFDIFSVTDGSILEGFRISTPAAPPQAAVRCIATGTAPCTVRNISILGTGGGIGVLGAIASQTLYCENVYLASGTVDVMFGLLLASNLVLINCGTILDSACTDFASLAAGGSINIQGVGVFGNALTGFRVAGGGQVIGQDLYFLGGANEVFLVTAPGASVIVENVNLQGNILDVLISDPADVTSGVILQGFWDMAKVSAPIAWFAANRLRGTQIGITENITIGPTGIGNLLSTSRIGLSSGPPSTVGMEVLRNTALDVGVWSNITSNMVNGIATDLFSTTASGAALYFGSDVPVWAVALNITQAAVLGVGAQFNAEYWDGASWSNISAMETDRTAPNATTPPKRRGRSWLTTLGGLYFRWGAPAAALLTLDGIDKFWLRITTAGGLITTQPRANEAKLVGNGEQRDTFGYIQYFGSASPNCDIMERKFKDLDITSASNPAAVTLTIGDLPYSLTIDDAVFANAATNRTTEITHLPGEIDTSRLAKLQIFYYRAAGTAGLNVLWEWSFQTKNNGELYTTVGATTLQTAVTVPAVVNTIEVIEFNFDFLNQRVAADTLLAWYLTRLGTDVLDTFDNSVNVLLIAANGYKWRP